MAEGWTRHLMAETIEAYSAGIETHGLNPFAVQVMREAGVDISAHQSQQIDEFTQLVPDMVVTVCNHAHESCPLFPGSCKVVHVGFNDPPRLAAKIFRQGGSKKQQLNCYRRVRDEIRDFIVTLPAVLHLQNNDYEKYNLK